MYRTKAFSAPFQDVMAHNLPCLCQYFYNCTENGFSLSTLAEKPLFPIIETCNSNKFFLGLNGVWKPPAQLDVKHLVTACVYTNPSSSMCVLSIYIL